jgi:hypothetical protein
VKITIDGHPLWDVPKPAADEIERLTARNAVLEADAAYLSAKVKRDWELGRVSIERLTAELNDAEAVYKDLYCKLDTLTATVKALEKAANLASCKQPIRRMLLIGCGNRRLQK